MKIVSVQRVWYRPNTSDERSDASDVRQDASGMRSDVSEVSVRCELSL